MASKNGPGADDRWERVQPDSDGGESAGEDEIGSDLRPILERFYRGEVLMLPAPVGIEVLMLPAPEGTKVLMLPAPVEVLMLPAPEGPEVLMLAAPEVVTWKPPAPTVPLAAYPAILGVVVFALALLTRAGLCVCRRRRMGTPLQRQGAVIQEVMP